MNEDTSPKRPSKIWTESDRRNCIQELFNEAREVKIDANAFLWFKLGYAMSSFVEDNLPDKDKLSNRFPEAAAKAVEYLTKILSECEPAVNDSDPDEIDLDELLRELVDEVDVVHGEPLPEEVTVQDVDELIAKLEQESFAPQTNQIPNIEEHVKTNAVRYEHIYHSVLDYVIQMCDKELMQIDDYEEEGDWKYADKDAVMENKKVLQTKVRAVADKKTRELLGMNEFEIKCFMKWLNGYNDNSGLGGNEWFSPVE